MAKREILIAPHPTLKKPAARVEGVDAEVRTLMDDMLETMYEAPGIGLAAPQVGVLRRVIVLDVANKGEAPAPLRLANPDVLWRSEDLAEYEEGCLSLPEQYAPVTRPARCKVGYLDENGIAREIEADGLLATCLQHEIDHLDGILFTDHLSAIKRSMIMRKLAKWKRANAA
ncbi:MAG: peptide deformylase [Azospirillaceae bacterium]